MACVAERVPGWWVAKTAPAKTLKFSSQIAAEHYLPLYSHKRPLFSYVFVRAIGQTNAWMCSGFIDWIKTGDHRAEVPDAEVREFRERIERIHAERKRLFGNGKCRVLLRVNGNTEIRADI